MPPIIDGIDIGAPFTANDVFRWKREGRLRGVTLNGYVTQFDWDGVGRWVHFTHKFASRQGPGDKSRGDRQINFDYEKYFKDQIESDSPIKKRTPQQRVASMALSMMAEAKQYGRIPGLDDKLVKAIAGEAWKEGEPITAEAVRRVAMHYLNVSETDAERGNNQRRHREYMKSQKKQLTLEEQARRAYEKKLAK
jgi:hypothetical protein